MKFAVVSLVMLFTEALGALDRRLLLDAAENTVNVVDEIQALKQQMVLLEASFTAKLAAQDTEIRQLKDQIGLTYVRWGRSFCDGNGTSTVYSGYMAGTYFENKNSGGSGANYLCLASQPLWNHYTESVNNGILITGVEYGFDHHQGSDLADFLGPNAHKGGQAPCAVCHVKRGSSIMIPGRNQCYPGWTEEYNGYLVTGYPMFDDSTEYVCLDKRPETLPGSATFHARNDLYFVEAKCGYDLECPPYHEGREISCVVCSK